MYHEMPPVSTVSAWVPKRLVNDQHPAPITQSIANSRCKHCPALHNDVRKWP